MRDIGVIVVTEWRNQDDGMSTQLELWVGISGRDGVKCNYGVTLCSHSHDVYVLENRLGSSRKTIRLGLIVYSLLSHLVKLRLYDVAPVADQSIKGPSGFEMGKFTCPPIS